jgi:hypothetical protein
MVCYLIFHSYETVQSPSNKFFFWPKMAQDEFISLTAKNLKGGEMTQTLYANMN